MGLVSGTHCISFLSPVAPRHASVVVRVRGLKVPTLTAFAIATVTPVLMTCTSLPPPSAAAAPPPLGRGRLPRDFDATVAVAVVSAKALGQTAEIDIEANDQSGRSDKLGGRDLKIWP